MESILHISRADIENNLSAEKAKVPKIIYLAMFLGVCFFFLVTLFLYTGNKSNLDGISSVNDVLNLYGYTLFIICIVLILMSQYVPKFVLSPSKLQDEIKTKNISEVISLIDFFISKLRVLLILRVAPLEGAAILGLVGLFLAITEGTIYVNNIYWLFLLPAVLFFIHILTNFPTKTKQIDLIEDRFLSALRTINM